MSRILVTGATGFVGRQVIKQLQTHYPNEKIVACGRREEQLESLGAEYRVFDLDDCDQDSFDYLGEPELVLHLAWSGLPNYKDLFHIEENVPRQYRFIKQMVQSGVKRIAISGTCFEYGLQEGGLRADTATQPVTVYGFAKDMLYKMLKHLQDAQPFDLIWCRFFYMYGEGQSPCSILSLLDRAIDRGDDTFPMSGGEQLRDYLPVQEVAKQMLEVALNSPASTTVNICSGNPISIRQLVETHIKKRKATIKLALGHYPYPDYEPMGFWGERS